ncbi:PrsW family intramembrane metalloprotease [Hanstruepera ponticola]|uniref:PrsW family intramembrane metalloprotease n=1 Tax=Hanstruepera ponticola TaxID=2042995 RepID=UPI000CF03DB5|nr:PrsW family glutamic-type intramembrane protease [Hanstruepera ponticola]
MDLALLSIAPVIIIILYVYLKDKYDKEPKLLLFFCFLFGAFVSIFITTLLYILFDYIIIPEENNIVEQFIKAFFIVGFTEEFSKYIIVRYYAQTREAFNEPYDGIIYAVMVSMGFAATENIFYVMAGGYEVALLRAVTAVPAHATFAILMGYYMGKAKFSKNRMQLNLIGLLLAIIFHGAYDFFLFIDFIPGVWIGAFVSLAFGIVLSRNAIKSHQNNSHFKA